MGLHNAGFEDIVGVDIVEQPEYPFTFILSDALMVDEDFFGDFSLIWASPPCQAYSCGTSKFRMEGKKYPDLVDVTRQMLLATKKPFVIENVPGAPIREDLMLCGEMFGLNIIRHRVFEIEGFITSQPIHREHRNKLYDGSAVGVWTGGYHPAYWGNKKRQEKVSKRFRDGNGKDVLRSWQEAMQITWIGDKKTLAQAVPPAYSEYIGCEFLKQMRGEGQQTLNKG